jgi:hypothetical protein
MALRVIELDIDEALSGDTRVEEIALVLQPAIETEFMWFSKEGFEETVNDYPQYIIDNAQRAKKYVDENGYGSCMTPVGKNRLNQLAKGEPISIETIRRMYSYLARHKKDLETSKSYEGSCGLLAYDSWGGVEALDWSEKYLQRIEEEMGYDVGSLTPWSQTSGTTEFKEPCYDGYEMIGMKEKDGKMVPNCVPIEGFTKTEETFVKPNSGEDKESYISRCIAYVRNEGKSAEEAAGKCYGMWDSHFAEVDGCGCGCSDGTIDTDGLYFGTTMINGMPVFESADEAATYAQVIGCNGSHEHMVDGKVVYMPCDVHNPEINQETSPEIQKYIEDRGVELEELLKQGWVIDEVNEVDADKIRKEMGQKFNKMKPEQFVQIITTPGEASSQDLGNKRFRYVYMVGFGSELIETSREMCRRMLGGRQFVFRYEDIVALSSALEAAPNSYKLVPRPKGTSVDCFQYKMGANCRHYWLQLVFSPGIAGITSEQTEQTKITNNARRMKEDADYQIPAPNMAGMVNPPVDYGSRSPQSVGMSKEEFRSSESRVIIVDVDDTLVRGNSPIQKTVDYVNRKWEDHRIVIVSARQKSRTGETERELDRIGLKWDEIYLSDFPQGPNAGNAFKKYKAEELKKKGYMISEAIDNSADARRAYSELGINVKNPTSLKALPAGFLQGLAIFKNKEDAKEWSFGCGCGGSYEPVDYLGEGMFQACSLKKQKMSTQFSLDEEKRMIYSPAMKPGILIPRLDEVTREKYFVTFKPETIERMAQRFLIEGRTNKTNYEHSDVKFEDVYLVESWIVNGQQDKAYSLGYTPEQVPVGTWMVGFRIDNQEVWDMIKQGQVKGISIEGNFEYKFSSSNNDDYLLEEIINILNQINQ